LESLEEGFVFLIKNPIKLKFLLGKDFGYQMLLSSRKTITADGTQDLKMNLLKIMKNLQDFHLYLFIFLMVIKKFVISRQPFSNS
jgi:hypothetical protein